MEDILTQLKLGLAVHLEKQGSSLEQFETALSNLNEAQGVVKVAALLHSFANLEKDAVFSPADFFLDAGKGALNLAGGALKTIPEAALTSALMAGSIGGAGAYGIKSYMDGQDQDFDKKQQEVNRVKSLTNRLKQDYGIHHNG